MNLEQKPSFDVKMMLLGKSTNDSLNSYPVLKMIMFFYTFLALAIGGIILLLALFALFKGKFLQFLILVIGGIFAWAIIKLSAEIIQIIVNIADNTRRTAEAMELLARKQE